MRPPRRLDEHAAVLAVQDLARHQPARPGWTCEAGCGDWPCRRYRGHMVATAPAMEISMVMASFYTAAVLELELQPAEVHRRMFGWIDGPQPPAPMQPRRPPGGPF